jgi:hypothetical protein
MTGFAVKRDGVIATLFRGYRPIVTRNGHLFALFFEADIFISKNNNNLNKFLSQHRNDKTNTMFKCYKFVYLWFHQEILLVFVVSIRCCLYLRSKLIFVLT